MDKTLICYYIMSLLLLSSSVYLSFLNITYKNTVKISIGLKVIVFIILFLACLGLLYPLYLTNIISGVFFIILIFSALVCCFCVYTICRDSDKNIYRILFIICLLAVLFITLFSRLDVYLDYIIITPEDVMKQIAKDSFAERFSHFILNVALFFPIGFLYKGTSKKGILYGVFLGLLLTVLIESLQFMFKIGECDILDIMGNTIGMLVGILFGFIFKLNL